jgi:hypothetical protein
LSIANDKIGTYSLQGVIQHLTLEEERNLFINSVARNYLKMLNVLI